MAFMYPDSHNLHLLEFRPRSDGEYYFEASIF